MVLRKAQQLLCVFVLCTAILIFVTPDAYAAGISVSAPSSASVGDTVSVSVTVSGSRLFSARVSYTVSGAASASSTILLECDNVETGASSLSSSFAFQAAAAGTVNISVNLVDWADIDGGDGLGGGSWSGTVTVSEGSSGGGGGSGGGTTSTPKPTARPGTTPAPTPIADVPVPEREVLVEILGVFEPMYVWHVIPDDVELPEGFEKTTITFNPEVEAAFNEQMYLTLLYATDAQGENGAFYCFDTEEHLLFPFVLLSSPGGFLILPLPEWEQPPDERLFETTVMINGQEMQAWQDPDGEPYLYVIYASYMNNSPGWYLFDNEQYTFQRYTMRYIELTPEPAPEPTPAPTPEPAPEPVPVPEEPGWQDKLRLDIIIIAALAIAVIAVVIIVLVTRKSDEAENVSSETTGQEKKPVNPQLSAPPQKTITPKLPYVPEAQKTTAATQSPAEPAVPGVQDDDTLELLKMIDELGLDD